MDKILHAVTTSGSLNLMEGQLEYLEKNNYDIHVASSPGTELESLSKKFKTSGIPMKRDINLVQDVISLIKVIVALKKYKPDLINYSTPKASLLFSIAGFLNRTPVRIYTIRGLRYETTKGLKKTLLIFLEKLIIALSTEVVTISKSVKEKLKEDGLSSNKNVKIFANGSSNGLKARYKNVDIDKSKYEKLYKSLKLENSFVIGFVGRINIDKGIIETIKIIEKISEKNLAIKFLLIGNFENKDIEMKINKLIALYPENIIHIPRNKELIYYYNFMDILLFPTHREGFGNVSIEAQSQGVPVITTDATGSRDTVIPNKTGFICKTGDWKDMLETIYILHNNRDLLKKMSDEAKNYALKNFDSYTIWREMVSFYESALNRQYR